MPDLPTVDQDHVVIDVDIDEWARAKARFRKRLLHKPEHPRAWFSSIE
ncbi:MAG TPA: hypothetical protein VIE65_04180 [Methylobacter sp.]